LKSLHIGCVKYLNARPLIHGWEGDVDFDHPSALCRRLATGELDVALVSSFEFLRNPIYRTVDDVSISSNGPVYSVVVAHRGEMTEVEEIALDPASETSVNLLRCLLAELGSNPRLTERSTGIPAGVWPAEENLDLIPHAQLLIGDQAIYFRQKHANELSFWDLGEQWKALVGLPFVYALWLVRPEVDNPKQIANRLRAVRDQNLVHLDELIAAEKQFDHELCALYYREHLRFNFGENEKQGLRVFANLCIKHGLLKKGDVAFDLV
jgi:chorismate dehydratase